VFTMETTRVHTALVLAVSWLGLSQQVHVRVKNDLDRLLIAQFQRVIRRDMYVLNLAHPEMLRNFVSSSLLAIWELLAR
jgi:hypothetical protein